MSGQLESSLGHFTSHPTIFKFINSLKQQQTLTELNINQFRAGTTAPPRRKYVESAKELKKLVEEYGCPNFSHIDYLRRISYRIRAD
jgi:hypothetical protein